MQRAACSEFLIHNKVRRDENSPPHSAIKCVAFGRYGWKPQTRSAERVHNEAYDKQDAAIHVAKRVMRPHPINFLMQVGGKMA